MAVFDTYEDEFLTLIRGCSKNVSQASTYESDGEKKLDLLNAVSRDLDAAKDAVRQMEVEARSQENSAARRALADKAGAHKQTLAAVTRDFEETKQQAERQSLLGGTGATDEDSLEQRSRLMSANDTLERGNSRIRHAIDLVAETEVTALEISDELARNRETIESAHARVHSVSGLADNARRVIRIMTKTEMQQKMIMCFVALVLVVVMGLIIYYASN